MKLVSDDDGYFEDSGRRVQHYNPPSTQTKPGRICAHHHTDGQLACLESACAGNSTHPHPHPHTQTHTTTTTLADFEVEVWRKSSRHMGHRCGHFCFFSCSRRGNLTAFSFSFAFDRLNAFCHTTSIRSTHTPVSSLPLPPNVQDIPHQFKIHEIILSICILPLHPPPHPRAPPFARSLPPSLVSDRQPFHPNPHSTNAPLSSSSWHPPPSSRRSCSTPTPCPRRCPPCRP
jgi:hypothetical protein